MATFKKAQFSGTEFVTYSETPGERGRFVARFKYRSLRGNRAGFIKFLMQNFTVEEYFARLDANEAPGQILESKGYVSTSVKKILKNAGFPETVAGKNSYLQSLMK